MSIKQCRIIHLPKIAEPRGNLTFVEGNKHIPFEIKRVYYVYDVPRGTPRGGHAHKVSQKLMIAISGSFDVVLDDGCGKQHFHLNSPSYGLYITPMVWREVNNFSSGSVAMVLASTLYDKSDYYRDYNLFIAAKKREKS